MTFWTSGWLLLKYRTCYFIWLSIVNLLGFNHGGNWIEHSLIIGISIFLGLTSSILYLSDQVLWTPLLTGLLLACMCMQLRHKSAFSRCILMRLMIGVQNNKKWLQKEFYLQNSCIICHNWYYYSKRLWNLNAEMSFWNVCLCL